MFFARIIVKGEKLSGDHVSEVFAEKQQIIRKSGLLEYYASEESFANVGGLAVLKDWLRKRSLAFSDQARAFGLPPPKGIMLLGVQGCGRVCARRPWHRSGSCHCCASIWAGCSAATLARPRRMPAKPSPWRNRSPGNSVGGRD
jgi:hypothetical protein